MQVFLFPLSPRTSFPHNSSAPSPPRSTLPPSHFFPHFMMIWSTTGAAPSFPLRPHPALFPIEHYSTPVTLSRFRFHFVPLFPLLSRKTASPPLCYSVFTHVAEASGPRPYRLVNFLEDFSHHTATPRPFLGTTYANDYRTERAAPPSRTWPTIELWGCADRFPCRIPRHLPFRDFFFDLRQGPHEIMEHDISVPRCRDVWVAVAQVTF